MSGSFGRARGPSFLSNRNADTDDNPANNTPVKKANARGASFKAPRRGTVQSSAHNAPEMSSPQSKDARVSVVIEPSSATKTSPRGLQPFLGHSQTIPSPVIDTTKIQEVVSKQISDLNAKHLEEMSKLRQVIESQAKAKDKEIEKLMR